MKSKKTKKALSGSVLALVLCFVMLIGTTFAWFTSSDSTAVNSIQAGTLKVALTDTSGNDLTDKALTWQKASGHENDAVLWEPGATYKTQEFKIANQGNLALKYKILLNGATGDTELLDVIDFKVVDAQGAKVDLGTFEGHLSPNTAETNTAATYYIQATMKTGAGNQYQGKKLDSIAITVQAGQYTEEYDSTTNMYDEKADLSTVNPATTAKLIMGGTVMLDSTTDLTIDSSVTGGNSETVRVTDGTVIIEGGKYTAKGTASNAALRVDGGTVTIKGGEFYVEDSNNCIYSAGGDIIIEGGKFRSEEMYNEHYWVLNVKDYSGGTITLKGGEFFEFDPTDAKNNTAPAGVTEIIVADGYRVESKTTTEGTWYKVVADTTNGD